MNASSQTLNPEATTAKPAMTLTRVATAAVLIPAVLAAIWWGGTGLAALLVGAVAVLSLWEFFSMGERIHLKGYRLWTALCAAGIVFQQWTASGAQEWLVGRNIRITRFLFAPELPLDCILFIFILGLALILLLTRRPMSEALGGVSISAAGLLFLVLPLCALIRLAGAPFIGKKLLIFTLVLVWVGDTMAYFVGRGIGRTRMAPEISPKKTWEGAIGGLVGSLGVGIVMAPWLHLTTGQALILAALGSIAGQIGDLLESTYKRSAGIKDSGGLLPGHGGMLDRVDALILAAPMVWYYFHMVLAPRN